MEELIVLGVVIAFALLISIPLSIARYKRLQKYWTRSCAGREWRQRFPNVPRQDIRAFLEVFVDAFGFKSRYRLKFSPTDKLMDVYRTVYPPGSVVDDMELETFALTLEDEYGVDFAGVSNLKEITLGEVFKMTRNANQAWTIRLKGRPSR